MPSRSSRRRVLVATCLVRYARRNRLAGVRRCRRRGVAARWLQFGYRDPHDGRWKGVVQYTTAPGSRYLQARDAAQLRAAG
jgi:hypothetical protein